MATLLLYGYSVLVLQRIIAPWFIRVSMSPCWLQPLHLYINHKSSTRIKDVSVLVMLVEAQPSLGGRNVPMYALCLEYYGRIGVVPL